MILVGGNIRTLIKLQSIILSVDRFGEWRINASIDPSYNYLQWDIVTCLSEWVYYYSLLSVLLHFNDISPIYSVSSYYYIEVG